MANITNGVVVQATNKEVTTKFGVKRTYSFKLHGGDWYRTGFKDSKVAEGDVISFDYTDSTYGKDVDASTIRKTGVAPVPAAAAPAPTADTPAPAAPRSYTGGGKGVFPIPALDGQRSIVRQNALTNAREVILKTVKDGATIANLDAFAASVIALARKFEAYTTGDLDMEEAVAEVEAESKSS